MATALAATTSLQVAPLVMAVDFRNPAVLAKEIATLDALFPGRVELGVGAGYNPLDYSRSGTPMDPPARRVSRLVEYVQVLRLLFSGEEVSFEGEEFHLRDITNTPAPATPGGPRILVAGGGPRLLRFAAASADIVGVNPSTAAGSGSPETFRDALPASIDAKVALVRSAAGVRWDQLELNAWVSRLPGSGGISSS
jgi:probable F420-dependent oxidoreductase